MVETMRRQAVFQDRREAGRRLAGLLTHYAGCPDVVVLALPRGGVPVAAEIAGALGVPLDVYVVRKLGVPGHAELAMGAIASGGVRVLNEGVIKQYCISNQVIDRAAAREQLAVDQQELVYRNGNPAHNLQRKTILLVDDGLATGATMRAAVQAIRQLRPASVVVAVPVGAAETCQEFESLADNVICACVPEQMVAVGLWYENFGQTTDEEVCSLLSASKPTSLPAKDKFPVHTE
jgi:predicted phosphoribosyltransferase